MQKKWVRYTLAVLVLCSVAVFALTTRRTLAANKKMYKSEFVGLDTIQSTLDQRAAEGWRLTAVSAYSHPAGSTNVERIVLVFEKE